MKIKDLLNIINKGMVILCFQEFDNHYDNLSEVKEEIKLKLYEKEVVMIDCINAEELKVFYK
ncbi:hypothetical protein [Clostridium rectalis]|uniref:hypothetical protein n=1 Tax=Clostridium rectalis TaxID=2040295 RepID=UPI000F634FCB|nr:hypothetical protein [Clostridium rectalis]